MRIILLYTLLLFASSLYSQSLQFINHEAISLKSNSYTINSNQSILTEIFISIQNLTNTVQNYTLMFDEGQNTNGPNDFNRVATYLSNSLSYQIFSLDTSTTDYILNDYSNTALNLNNVIGNNTSAEQIQANDTKQFSFYLLVHPLQYVQSGTYTDTVRVKLYNKTLSNITSETDSLDQTLDIPVTIQIESIQELSINPLNTSLNFGIAQSNLIIQTSLDVLTNESFKINLQSSNNGSMVHETNPINGTKIPYLVRFKTLESNYSSWQQPSGSIDTLLSLTTLPMNMQTTGTIEFKISSDFDPSSKLSGDYSDTVTLTISEY